MSGKEENTVLVDPLKATNEEEDALEAKKKAAANAPPKHDGGKTAPSVIPGAEALTEEDAALMERLETLVATICGLNSVNDETAAAPPIAYEVREKAVDTLAAEVRSSTASVTSVPKALKFLRAHYAKLCACMDDNAQAAAGLKTRLADVLSVLAMSFGEKGKRECLKYKLLGNQDEVGAWGTEYARHLAGEISAEYQYRRFPPPPSPIEPESTKTEDEDNKGTGDGADENSAAFKAAKARAAADAKAKAAAEAKAKAAAMEVDAAEFEPQPVEDLLHLVRQLVPYNMEHHAEPEAVDLLYEVEQLETIGTYVEQKNYRRVALYLLSFAPMVAEPQNSMILRQVLQLYRRFEQFTDALRVSIKLGDKKLCRRIFEEAPSNAVRSQMAYILGRQHLFLLDDADEEDEDGDAVVANADDEEAREALIEKINNAHLSESFLELAADLEVLAPKKPEQVYKAKGDGNTRGVDSARSNLAATFVNAFVNAAFGDDTLMTLSDQNAGASAWIHKNKDHGMMSAAASLGMVLLWDVDGGLAQIDALLEYGGEDYVKAGALLSVGIVNSGVRHEVDPALALLSEHVCEGSAIVRTGAIFGLALAYAGSQRRDVVELVEVVLDDTDIALQVRCMAALCIGMVMVGTGDHEIAETMIVALMDIDVDELKKNTHSRYFSLGIGLIYLGLGDTCEVTAQALDALDSPYARLTVDSCAYAGTGNALKVQEMLHMLADTEESEESRQHYALAVLTVGMIAMGEEISVQMARRTMDHLLHYGDEPVRRGVPLALALMHVSTPDVTVTDTLSKLSHDQQASVAHAAILGLGIVGAGTNNARIGSILEELAVFHEKDASNLFLVRLSQGLLHLGKGLLTLSPFHSHQLLMSRVAVAGLLVAFHSMLDTKEIILGDSHYMLYSLVAAMWPRMLMTYDENGKQLNVPVRVGQAVDTIGHAGKPKTITGFQTQSTPVLLGQGDRAELATEDYLCHTEVLEDFVILRTNPNAPEKSREQKKIEADLQKNREEKRKRALERREKEQQAAMQS